MLYFMAIDAPKYNQEDQIDEKKLSIKQQFMKLFITSDLKNKKLWRPLRKAKIELIKNLHDGWCDVEKVNSLFWIYFHDHKDVHIPHHLKPLISKQRVFVDRVDASFSLEEYLFVLKKIRLALEPFTKSIQKMLVLSQTAQNDLDVEQTQEKHHMFNKQQFSNILSSSLDADEIFHADEFTIMSESIWKTREQDEYKNLILFTVLGIHYFDKKQFVYSILSQENFKKSLIHFQWSTKKNQSTELILQDFLAIIDQLNFKKHFFDL